MQEPVRAINEWILLTEKARTSKARDVQTRGWIAIEYRDNTADNRIEKGPPPLPIQPRVAPYASSRCRAFRARSSGLNGL